MAPPRKPKNGLDKPVRKLAGTPRENPKEKPPRNVATTNDKKTWETGLQDPKNNTTTEKHTLKPDTETVELQDVWQTVHGNRGHLLQKRHAEERHSKNPPSNGKHLQEKQNGRRKEKNSGLFRMKS